MSRATFRPAPVEAGDRVRIDTATGSTTPAAIVGENNEYLVEHSMLKADSLGNLPAFRGADGVTALWRKVLDYKDNVASSVAITGVVPSSGADLGDLSRTYELIRNFNVLSYGAIGDGTADDTVAVQAAVTAAAVVGGTVWFPPGREYKITASLSLPSHVTLLGAGPGYYVDTTIKTSRLKWAGAANLPMLWNADRVNGNFAINIVGLFIMGIAATTPPTTAGSVLDFSASTGTCHAIHIEKCTIYGGYHSIALTRVQESMVSRVFTLGSLNESVYLNNSFDNTIADNEITVAQPCSANGHGVSLTNDSPGNMIRNNFIFLCNSGIQLVKGAGNNLTGNRCNTNKFAGIDLIGIAALDIRGASVTGGVCYDNGTGLGGTQAGVVIRGATSYVTVNGVSTYDNAAAGARTQKYGVLVKDTADLNIVTACVNYNNITGGVVNTGSGVSNVLANNV